MVLVSLETLEMKEALEVGGYNKFNFKHAGFWVLWYILMSSNDQKSGMPAKEEKICGLQAI